ncbi:uncharacterized protein LOC113359516 [Papaver somniferum]|uniref:uncharacterized protein LOC113359516 n=1 Tax=Papaver somniferum TaxID=3469 RepID=UPI000E6FA982|nr:uncharacterized protein LOC113359516 [Papaver somniferum]
MNSKEKYLGSPLILGHSKQESFKSIKENFENIFSTWNSISLSQAGRGTMIKHVLDSVSIYHMGTFKLPNNLINQLTFIERKFFWGYHNNRGNNPIAWHKVYKPKEQGGLAFRDLEKLNLSILTKLAWRLCNEPYNIISQFLSSKYFKSGDIIHQNISAKNCSYAWNGIAKGLQVVQQNYFMGVNNGKRTKFLKERWILGMIHPPTPMLDIYRFYEEVAELLLPDSHQWNVSLLNKLFDADTSNKIQNLFIDNTKEDVMVWMPARDGKFSVKSTYKKLTMSNK